MKKIGKKVKGSELFTVIEPGLLGNQLSEMEKGLILGGGDCPSNYCGAYSASNDTCPANYCGVYWILDDNVCSAHICFLDFECDIDVYSGSSSDEGSESESFSSSFSDFMA